MFYSTQAGKVLINPVKLHSEGLVHLLIYISYNNNLSLRYYASI